MSAAQPESGSPDRGSVLPRTLQIATRGARDPYATEDDYQDWGSGSEEGGGGSGSEAAAAAQPEFPELLAAVRAAIAELGGRVLPKLSWSCPKVRAGAVGCGRALWAALLDGRDY